MAQLAEGARAQALIDECLPLIRQLGRGRRAVTIGGSRGKRVADARSDIDFRLFCDEIVDGPRYWEGAAWQPFADAVERWRADGLTIDWCWVRSVAEVDAQLAAWLGGAARPDEKVWTVWGYHLLTDLENQVVIEDPHGLVAAWQAQLRPYPPALRQSILEQHLAPLRYWRDDYHYRSKVARGDLVFLAGLTARLVHSCIQVLCAHNEVYYVGDGGNLQLLGRLATQPERCAERVAGLLYPGAGPEALARQHADLLALIDDVLALVERG